MSPEVRSLRCSTHRALTSRLHHAVTSLSEPPPPKRDPSPEPRPNQVAGNRLRGCGADGVRVGPGGKGRYQNNVARECAGCGVRIERDGAPDMRANELEVRSRLEP